MLTRKQHKCNLRKVLYALLILPIILASAGQAPAKAQSETLPEYVVQSGDSLYAIALQFYTTIDEIMRVNGLTDSNVLNIGDHLKIPGLEGLQGTLTSDYVPLGANLRSLSRRTQSDTASLIRLNKFTSPSELFIGRKIIITTSEATQSMETLPSLLPGQSWMELAILKGQNPWSLARVNNLASPTSSLPMDTYYAQSATDSPNNLAIPGIKSMVIDNLPLIQGSTFVIKVDSEEPVQLSANLAGTEPVFFPTDDGGQIAFGGIKALLEPGAYPLTIEVKTSDEVNYRFDQWVLVDSGNFETDATLQVDPSTIESDNVKAEDAVFQEIVSKATPIQQWEGMFLYPVEGSDCVRSNFGSRRTYNNDNKIYYHTGLDIGYCNGIDVFAPAKGTVVAALPEQIVRGNVIVVDHGLGVFSIYMHLKEMLVQVGDVVEPGQLIGYIGTTGRSIGPHLHFEVDINGIPVNPVAWLNRTFP
ncbi:MAG: peptidoglycan DD-metalloendopeptidase family protein [Anaerolineaceae bacterium]